MYTYMVGICIAAEQLRCSTTVVWWTGSEGREPLHSPAPDWTDQLGTSRYMPTTGHHQLLGGLPCYPGVSKSNGGSSLVDGAQSTIGIQGPWIVHEADRAIRVTHLLSCTGPVCSWHGQAPPHVATHRAPVYSQSILLGIWYLHAGSCA